MVMVPWATGCAKAGAMVMGAKVMRTKSPATAERRVIFEFMDALSGSFQFGADATL